MRVDEIKMLTSENGLYRCDFRFKALDQAIEDYVDNYGLVMDSDFQRGHVWTKEQQTAYMEFLIRGGRPSHIKFNDPSINGGTSDFFVVVDGLQRLTAMLEYLKGNVKVFGHYPNEIEGIEKLTNRIHIPFMINSLKTKKEVLRWYLELNTGGTPHTEDEINKVKGMLESIS